ncbi:MAG: type III pantothenate kinase [Candidatus Omnitrophica bacterium]|nr:type III pantothenate kinase [Candidatus Omnitrophota bacterium]
MLLAVDIGNTTITFALMKSLKVVKIYKVDTTQKVSALKESCQKTLARLQKYAPEETVICSVVPRALKVVEAAVQKELERKPKIVGRNLKVPMKNRYAKPRQVGQDRLVGAYAAMELYGKPTIVVDLGTAITFDIVSKKKEYIGGIIVPGIRLSAEALSQKTALLPKIDIHNPPALIGKDTENSILSGLFYGYGEMIGGIISLLFKKIPGHPTVIVTGGHTKLMKKYIVRRIDAIDPDLVLKGMALLAL